MYWEIIDQQITVIVCARLRLIEFLRDVYVCGENTDYSFCLIYMIKTIYSRVL